MARSTPAAIDQHIQVIVARFDLVKEIDNLLLRPHINLIEGRIASSARLPPPYLPLCL